MKFYELHILKKLDKDAVAVSRWNRKTVEKFKRAGYVSSLGVAKKGPLKGKGGIIIQPKGIEYKEKLERERAEHRKLLINAIVAVIAAVIGAAVGSFVTFMLTKSPC